MALKVGELFMTLGLDKSDFDRKAGDATRYSNQLAVALAAAAAAAGAAGIAMIKSAANMEQNTIAFKNMLGSGEAATRMLEELEQFAAHTPFEFPGLVDASRKLLAFGFAAEEILPMMTAMGDAVAGLGGGAFEIDRITRALGQMQAKGKIASQEMMQLTELGIPAWQMLADSIGVSIPEAMDLVERRMIDAETGIAAILQGMTEKFGGQMADQSTTINGLWSNLMDNIGMTGRAVGDELIEAFNLRDVLQGAIEAVAWLGETIREYGLVGAFDRIFSPEAKTAIVVIAGAIAGALIPSLIALAGTIAGVIASLGPWALAGAAIVGLIYAITNHIKSMREQAELGKLSLNELLMLEDKYDAKRIKQDTLADVERDRNDMIRGQRVTEQRQGKYRSDAEITADLMQNKQFASLTEKAAKLKSEIASLSQMIRAEAQQEQIDANAKAENAAATNTLDDFTAKMNQTLAEFQAQNIAAAGATKGTGDAAKDAIPQIEGYSAKLTSAQEALVDFYGGLLKVQQTEALMGAEYDDQAAKIGLYRDAILALEASGEDYSVIVAALKIELQNMLQAQQDAINIAQIEADAQKQLEQTLQDVTAARKAEQDAIIAGVENSLDGLQALQDGQAYLDEMLHDAEPAWKRFASNLRDVAETIIDKDLARQIEALADQIEAAGQAADDSSNSQAKLLTGIEGIQEIVPAVSDILQELGGIMSDELPGQIQRAAKAVQAGLDIIAAAISGNVIVAALKFALLVIEDLERKMDEIAERHGRKAYEEQLEAAKELSAAMRELDDATNGWIHTLEGSMHVIRYMGKLTQESFEVFSGIAETLAGGLQSAFEQGIEGFLRGEEDWKERLTEGVRNAIISAIVSAVIQSAVIQGILADELSLLTALLTAGNYDAAQAVIDNIMGQLPGIMDMLTGPDGLLTGLYVPGADSGGVAAPSPARVPDRNSGLTESVNRMASQMMPDSGAERVLVVTMDGRVLAEYVAQYSPGVLSNYGLAGRGRR